MKRFAGIAVCFLGVLFVAASMAAAAASMEPVETEDGLFKLTVMELHDDHGVTQVAGKIANNSGQDYKTAGFTLVAYRADGAVAAKRDVKVEDLANGSFRVFRVDVNAYILSIASFGIVFNPAE